ncbi:histone deacetylase 6 isoform X2 [Hyposmocoma kahamanoa]|uniref:histone deacetylase 6 isoform X2 n=1 Tax=Hyposmocoma kahamanoa TaxID=1477025 RepID=UPI000E6D9009|nr:histone deacetylase 6 isoform X2 [Hyposmocoma kahamanoa]
MKKTTPPATSIVTRNGARKAKIQTRAMSAGAKAMDSKTRVKGPTGFVTEPRMAEHRCLWDENYPECPERLIGVIDRCRELNLIEQCKEYPPRAATKEELCVLHSPSVYELMETTHLNQDLEYLEEVSSRYDAIYIHPSTHELALIAAGSTIDIVDRVITGEIHNGAAFVRPPGHHAMRAEPCGYCFYNNVALAAKHALDKGVNRILIVDWDVHHGQATQQMFYDDPRVVYFSIHRYEYGAFWPSLRQSDFHYIGCGQGKGYTFNVPLNQTGMQDADYLAIWHQLLLPMAVEYAPELVIVSAGYDSALGDEKGEMEITPACYPHLLNMLMSICSSICVVLEGGYCIPSLAEGAALTLRTLLGHAPPVLQALSEPTDSIRETILNSIYVHKPYWRCYNYQPTYRVRQSVPNVCDDEKQKHTVSVKWEGDETRPDRYATRDCYPLQDNEVKRKNREKLDHLRIVTNLALPQHQVCYIYHPAMLKHKNVCEPGHVECPERIMRIHERHRDYGLLDRLHQLTARAATDLELLSVHSEKHLDRLKELASTKLRDLNSQKDAFDSVYFHPDSLESATMASGCVLQAVDAVLSNEAGSGVCVIRPPGHHADEEIPSGFCLLNNAATAAKYAIDSHGLKRVLILDWDVHHGNGTQRITYKDDKILYMSIHRYDNGSFFPHSTDADYNVVGEGKGKGFNVNIPWNKRGMGDTEYLAAFTQVVLPIAYEYNPELVIVSAGFDACIGDPLGGCKVTPECYGRMTHFLRGLAGGRVILCLEGGYNITSISYSMTMCTKALLGDPLLHHYDPTATCHWSAAESINNVIKTHKKYWKNLKFQLALPIEPVLDEPLPSIGLIITEDQNSTVDSDRLSGVSSSTLDDSPKSNGSRSTSDLNYYLEGNMAALSIRPKCNDGLHCGTDDEDNERNEGLKQEPKKQRTDVECFKVDKTIIGRDSSSNQEASSSNQNASISNQGASTSKQCRLLDNPSNVNHGGPIESRSTATQTTNPSSSNASQGAAVSAAHGVSTANRESSSTNQGPSSTSQGGSNTTPEDKQTLVDYLAENMQALVDEEMFAVIPQPWCPHLESLFAIPSDVKFSQGVKCVDCEETVENWVCLHCFITACGRSINGHMQAHYRKSSHPLVLSLLDLSVWCNECDAYIDNPLLYDAKNNAHREKFNEDMPWCYRSDTIQMH